MEGPSGVVALVLAETAAGGAALLWLTGLWGKVKRGFFILTGAVALVCGLLATLAASASVEGTVSSSLRLAVVLSALTTTLLGVSLAALILRADRIGFIVGVLSVPAAVAMLVALARVSGPSFPSAVAQLLAGAALMGAAMDGLLLGHWYLVDRKLGREPIRRHAVLLIVAVALEALAVALLGFGEASVAGPGFSPFLGIAGLSTWLALGMVACTGLIAILIRASLRTPRSRAVQAATGFFYLAVITAFTAEMAAKVGFLR
jgi:hypothetical protein